MVVQDLLSNQLPEITDINLVNGNGVNGWGGVFGNLLRFLDAPALLVYDKRNVRLQEGWDEVRRMVREQNRVPKWSETPLASLLEEVTARRGQSSQHGDHELRQVLTVLRKQVLATRDPALALRVHLFGLIREDIVDYLPVTSFPKALELGDDWAEVRKQFRKKFGDRATGEKFKDVVGVFESSVKKAIADNMDRVEPELAELADLIRRLVDEQENPPL